MKANHKAASKPPMTQTAADNTSQTGSGHEHNRDALHEYQAILATAEEVAQIGSWKWDLRTQKVTWSDEMFRLFGVEREGFNGDVNRVITERIHPEDAAAVAESNRGVLEEANPTPMSYRLVLPDGTERTVWAQGKLIRDENGQPQSLTGYVQDITERVRAEKKIIQLKRLYATLSQVNQMIVRVREEQELYQTFCNVAAEFGEFCLAWIGLLDEASGEVRPVAARGLNVREWPFPAMNINDEDFKDGLIPAAIRTSSVVISENIQVDPRMKALHSSLRLYPYRAAAVIPFHARGKTMGVFVLVSDEEGLFNEADELRLLDEMGLDISFALDGIESEKERRKANAALSESESRYRSLVETSSDGIFINRQDQIVFMNQRGLEMLGAENPQQILGRSPFEIFHPDSHALVRGRIKILLEDKLPVPAAEETIVTLDGRPVPVEVTATPVVVDGISSIQVVLRDITDRKRAEQVLRESEEKYRTFFETSMDAILLTSPDGSIHEANPAACRMVGLTEPEVCALGREGLVDTSDPALGAILAERARTGRTYGELTMFRGDGSRFPAEISSALFPDRDGNIRSSIIARDITERKKMEEQLEERKKFLEAIMETSPDIVYLYDPRQQKHVYINREIESLLGYTREELMDVGPTPILKEIHPHDTPGVIAHMEKLLHAQTDEMHPLEYRIRGKTGAYLWFYVREQVYQRDEQGNPKVLFGVVQNVTERKKTEEALKRNEQVLRLFVEHSPAAIAMFDRDMRYIIASKRFLIDYGLGEQELTGRSHYEVFPEMPERWKEVHRRCLQGTIEKAEEDPFPRQHGGVDWVRWEIHPWYEETGNIGGIILFSEVVTDRKRAQDELRLLNLELEQRVLDRTMELSHANRAKDEFLANMSHELRTPLNTVLGLSESLLEQRRGPLNEKQARSVELIASSGQHLLGLINDILEVSKIEAGKLQLHPVTVSVRELCESSINFVKELALKKMISVEFSNEESISTLHADPQRVKQILINLLTNAVKFTPDKSRVSLDVSTNAEKDQIRFAVADSGIGIAPEDLKKLFTPFTQLDSSLARQHAGTGLGLTLVQKLTDLHGGSVQVESEVGRGSRFTVVLPLVQDIPEQTSREGASDPANLINEPTLHPGTPGERGIVLLAEDNRINAQMVAEYLEMEGYKVLIAEDGEQVIEKAMQTTPDLVLMDIQMPKMDGLEAMRRLRMDPRFASTPIIALTSLAMPGDRERCLEAGANEYLSKPVRLKMLIKVIAKLTE